MNKGVALALAWVIGALPGVVSGQISRWDAGQRFYRLTGTNYCMITGIYGRGVSAVAWSNNSLGGTVAPEAQFDMLRTNWVVQEHLRMAVTSATQWVILSDPTRLPKTGQTNYYRPGDDGDKQRGCDWPSPRFTVLANTNEILDNLSGLTWSRNAGLSHNTWGFSVQQVYVLIMGTNEDWRLPNIRELESLLDYSMNIPALPAGHPFNNLQPNYWSSTPDVSDTNRAWVLGLADGTIARWARTNTVPYAWPVRGTTCGKMPVPRTGQTNSVTLGDDGFFMAGVPWPRPRFTILPETNMVFDNLTGRSWTRQVGLGPATNWYAAVDFCTGLVYAGKADWRLPNRREVWSLIDFGNMTFLPADQPFIGAPSSFFWTSTTCDMLTNRAWIIEAGHIGAEHIKADIGGVWPVRGSW